MINWQDLLKIENLIALLGLLAIIFFGIVNWPNNKKTAVTSSSNTQNNIIDNNSGNLTIAGRDVVKIENNIYESRDYKDLKQDLEKAERNFKKYPEDHSFATALGEAQKKLSDFKRDILKLAKEIDEIPLNSERGKKAKKFFDESDYQKARETLDEKEMGEEKQALLKKEDRLQKEQKENTDKLNNLAAEYVLKARLTAVDYQLGDQRILKTQGYFEETLEFGRTPERLFNYAHFLQENNQFKKSEALYQEALTIRRNLAEQNSAVYLPDVATTLNNLGNLLSADSSRRSDSEALYQEALKIRRALAEQNPEVYLPHVSMTLNNLGNLLSADSSRRSDSEALYQEALTILRKLAEQNPAVYLPYVANTLAGFGNAYLNWANHKKAIPYLQESYELFTALAKQSPEVFTEKLEMVKRLLNEAKENK